MPRTYIYNFCIALNCLLLFLAFFGANMQLPMALKVVGRMHPLVLHFPIVLLVLTGVWAFFIAPKFANIPSVIGHNLLLFTAISSALAALMGLFLGQEGDYNADILFWHKWSGVGVAVLTWAGYAFRDQIQANSLLSKSFFAAGLVAITIAGHKGAAITHGENYLLAPLGSPSKIASVAFEDARVFEDLVYPILKEKCLSCHNATKLKGELSLETPESILKGGKHGKLWDLNDPELGLLLHRAHLPLEDEEHMPPKGKPQLTDEEINILYHWIKGGSNFKQKVVDLPQNDSLAVLAAHVFSGKTAEIYDFAAASADVIKQLNNDYRAVYPLSLASPALGVEFYGISAFKSAYIGELKPVREQIVSLNLNKMPITDEDLRVIAGFPNLRKLTLSFTPITGATLGELKNLKHLKKLSLSSTKINAAALMVLKDFPALNALYLWNSALSADELAALKASLPKTNIETGYSGDTVIAKLNAPILEGEEQIFTTSAKVLLKNYINGAVVRYTLDGTIPDSLTSLISPDDDSIAVDKSCVLTAKTFLPGWISSDIATRNFYKVGFMPDSVTLRYPPNPTYAGEGPKTVANKKIGDSDFRSNKWLGFDHTSMEAYLYFNEAVALSTISISSLVNISNYIMPAEEIEVWGGLNGKFTLLKRLKPEQPKSMAGPNTPIGYLCSFPTQKMNVVKVKARPVQKLPSWHPGKGTVGWFFVDEIFLN